MPEGGRKSKALATVKIAVFAPMPIASDSAAVAVKTGLRRSSRNPCAASCPRSSTQRKDRASRCCSLTWSDVAKGQPCGTPRRVRRQCRAVLEGVLQQCQVGVNLTGEIVVRPAHAEQVQQAFEKATHGPRLLSVGEQQFVDPR